MNDTLIAAIRTFALDMRKLLEQEAAEQLEGIYGWTPDGKFGAIAKYPALKLSEAVETRARLESYATEEADAAMDAKSARQRLVREAAFTWLNRFVAFRLMEERKLIKVTVSRLLDSNAYKFWLADEKDPESLKLHDAGEVPLNAMGEGRRHIAYRRFILWQCGELAADVSVLFDRRTLSSRIFPRPLALKALVGAMNAPEIAEAWTTGNEDIVGWIYESFIWAEKKVIYAGFAKKMKATPDQICPATQFFTPRWVVRYLVENSLGRFWVEMHPDSHLKDTLGYLVPKESRRPMKPARDISFLDPACGSMHFGLVAFDLFAQMYREEIENAGKPGWPKKPSVAGVEDIPAAIIERNIHGIDLDLRAVQLSALTLLLRARTMNPKCAFTDKNLACANVEQITGGRLEEFIKASKFRQPIYERILRALADRLKLSENLGSLLRIEEDVEHLVAEERKKAEGIGELSLLPGEAESQLGSTPELEKFFARLEGEIQARLDEYVRRTRKGADESGHFAVEASKGLRFLRLVRDRYDIVVTNPPYMSRRNQSGEIAGFLDKNYPGSKSDLYAAFIERCAELTAPSGKVAMITQQSFMFISSYEDIRASLRECFAIEDMVHLGPRAFEMVTGEKVNTTAFVLRKEPDAAKRGAAEGVYFRLVHERDADAKRTMFESALAALRAGKPHPLVFRYRQSDFDAIPGKPWVYWMPIAVREKFQEFPLLHDAAPAIHGTATYDNRRFLRYWWECGIGKIGRTFDSWNGFANAESEYVPYMKGGTPRPWYGNQTHVLRVARHAAELTEFLQTKRDTIRGIDYCFRKGVTWSDVSSKGFAARLSPGGFIHDVKGMTCYPAEDNIANVLGLLNSRFAQFILSAINPTISFQVGDIERLPVPAKRSDKVANLVNQCVELTRQDSRESEITYDFVAPLSSPEAFAARKAELAKLETEIDAEVSKLYGLSDDDLAVIERELAASRGESEAEKSRDGDEDDSDEAEAGVTPAAWARAWISYAVGIVLGRFEISVKDGLGCGNSPPETVKELKKLVAADGILVNDPGQPLDLASRVWKALEMMLGPAGARKRVNLALGGGAPEELLAAWFDHFSGDAFWKYHLQQYRKRPVYWPIQSPAKHYTRSGYFTSVSPVTRSSTSATTSLTRACAWPNAKSPISRNVPKRTARRAKNLIGFSTFRTTSASFRTSSRASPTGATHLTSTTASSSMPPPSMKFFPHGRTPAKPGRNSKQATTTGRIRPWITGPFA